MLNTIVSIPGYRISEKLYNGSRTLVYRGYRETDSLPVVIKLLKNPYPSFSELLSFRNQYTIAKNLNSPLIIQTYSLEPYQNGYALVMEDFGGISLKDYFISNQTRNITVLQEFLEIAIALCNTLDILYRERIIHKDIKPANIVINPETKKVKLIDFSIASLLPRETQTLINPNILEGTLAYISPEQTGRMNRGIDYRTDFYSLGVTFYELLTGILPFQSNDLMELVHCHIAKLPPLVHEINPQISSVVSEIVSKLMAKNGEDRYQSALGLKFDLENCLSQLQVSGEIKSFPIAEQDVCDRFLIPDKLYGRETEVETLLQAFERVSIGATEMILVAGFSGIGKTAVVNEVHKPIVRQRGYFIKGKFDQFNRNIPFSAFVQVFRDLMGQLLSESDTELYIWKTQILQALGDNGQVIIEVIPELEHIIGKQVPATELSGTAAQNRFNLLFQKFIQVFTTKEHPLVMFLDDLQWADSASLNLIQLLMNESESHYLLMIGAYRDNEVSPAHPLMLTLDAIAKANATINTITLRPLSQGSLNKLVADTLNCHILTAQALTELIAVKTKGNPFFATQFLKALYQDGLIQFDLNLGHWQCDLAKIRTVTMSDDVVEFMASQLQKLPSYTQDILKLAACIGAQFDLNTLAIVSQESESDAAVALWKAVQEGLILPQSELYKFYVGELDTTQNPTDESLNYKFLHDRVQQAAYSLIPDDRKQITHLTIGRLLYQATPADALNEQIFAIANHFNQGISLISDPQEQQELVQLNLKAGRKAITATAYTAAAEYATISLGLLMDNCWAEQYETTLALHNLAATGYCFAGDFAAMEALVEQVLQHTRSLLDQVEIYQIRIRAFAAQSKPLEAAETTLETMRLLGVDIPATGDEAAIGAAFQAVAMAIARREPADFLEQPAMTNPHFLAALDIFSTGASPVYITRPDIYPLYVLKAVELSVIHGNALASCYAYANYGILLAGVIGDSPKAYAFGQLGINLLSRHNAQEFKARTMFVAYAFTLHWQIHLRETLPFLQQTYLVGLETGDTLNASYGICCYTSYAAFVGINLADLAQETDHYSQAVGNLNQQSCYNYLKLYRQLIENLLGATGEFSPYCLQGEAYDERTMLPLHQTGNDYYGLATLFISKLVLAYLFQEFQQAAEFANTAAPLLPAVLAMPTVPVFYLYDSLTLLALLPQASAEQQQMSDRIASNQAKMKYWAEHAPMNFLHKFYLIEAEQERVRGDKLAAMEHYDQAIALARENKYINEEALANELAARFYLDWGKEKIATPYLQEAYYCYARWGAKAKTDDLETRYPHLLCPILQQTTQSIGVNTLDMIVSPAYSHHFSIHKSSSSSSINTTLDFAAILKASQALSRTIQLEDLLYQLTQIILQNSGGDRCALILPNENQVWEVRAIATPTAIELYSEPLENNPNLPVKLIQYVKNTQQVVVIDDLKTDLPVIDNYLRLHQPKSVLCLPILNQGNLVGILYLKNRLTSGVFTSDRIIILDFLCTQVAISLENARLYNQAQQSLTNLQNAQLQIVQSEKMSALGNLVAGVAHEMNNPLGFISASLKLAKPTFADIIEHLKLYQENLLNKTDEIKNHAEEIDLDYSLEDLPKIIDSMTMACDRLKNISTSLRTFSRADKDYKVPFNIHEGIDSTILILKHRLKANEERPEIEVITDYGNLSQVECFPGQLNQVFMNILANAIDALDESNIGRSFTEIQSNPNQITIKTSLENEGVKIAIADNGKGMSEQVKSKVFDHLFTTKGVGKGTGLGLAIARQIVVEKHGGGIEVDSRPGEGTEFVIQLPL